MVRLVLLSALLLGACQHSKASQPRPIETSAARAASTQGGTSCPKTCGDGITDPEGPRIGESVEQELVSLNAVFDAQPFDEPWRTTQEARFRKAFVDAGRESALAAIECRRTLCRLTVLRTRDERRGLHQIVANAASEEDGFVSSFSFASYPSTDRSRATVYVSRNHYQLPDAQGNVKEHPKRRSNSQ